MEPASLSPLNAAVPGPLEISDGRGRWSGGGTGGDLRGGIVLLAVMGEG